MKSVSRAKAVMVCCSVLRAEVESLCQARWPDHQLKFLPSMMHMHPERLASSLESILEGELKQGHRVVLTYGDCCARMTALEALPRVARTRGKNCCELLLGPEEYRRLSHEGAFFLIPEWACRWKEIFTKELGLNRDNATCLMQEIHHKLTYLDTGLAPVPENALKECAEYCGLPYEIRPVSLERLRLAIEEALLRTGAPI
jgi:hypothetical protein